MVQFDSLQSAALDAVSHTSRHVLIEALAGSGKTTVLIEAAQRLLNAGKGSIIFVAFNTDIAKELKNRVPYGVEVSTLHSVGLKTIASVYPQTKVDHGKMSGIYWPQLRKFGAQYNARHRHGINVGTLYRPLSELVELAQSTLPSSIKEVEALVAGHVVSNAVAPSEFAQMIVACLQQTTATRDRVSFGDMLYLPAKLKLSPPVYQHVFVDEVQDLNNAQLELVQKMLWPGTGRLIAIGDRHQAIYGWRGAAGDAFGSIQRTFDPIVCPLSVTYRCSKAVVAEANKIVPDLKPRATAPAGQVSTVPWTAMFEIFGGARPGDFILSRTNAPLMRVAQYFMKRSWRCVIAGKKDFSQKMLGLVRDLKAASIVEVRMNLQKMARTAITTFAARSAEDQVACQVSFNDEQDLLESVLILSETATSLDELVASVQALFVDLSEPGALDDVIVLSTIHRAKGRERSRVWLLQDTFVGARSGAPPAVEREELNLWYVGVTRAKDDLFLVQSPEKKGEDPDQVLRGQLDLARRI